MKVCGSALLLRYSEGATLLAIVLVRVLYSCYFRLAIMQYIVVRVLHLEQSTLALRKSIFSYCLKQIL